MNFSGEHFKALDDKGRLSIPREFREQLNETGNRLVLTKNMEGGLTLFSPADWVEFVKRLEEIPTGKQRNALNRLYLAPKTDIQVDKQGRIPLSRAQRIWLGLIDDDREVVLVGNFHRIDLFSIERYREVVSADVSLIKENEALINKVDLP
ncbi:MAG: division/cell wall cluster transcriptional repressor MraZ [Desulfuromonas sp.]|nr:MAG: division/cell wall cluster transcriptional repressor MraZ [Desulfuromonas sp.]